jgi:phosphoribosylaminoimidazolecarboxamide formyltransferase/IMP cyclohydrolase
MLRSASKNFQAVAVLVDPSDYEKIIQEIKGLDGDLSYKTRLQLAKKVFSHTSRYDTIITDYLTKILEDMGDKK